MKRQRSTNSTKSARAVKRGRTARRKSENISPDFLEACEAEFKADPSNVISRNAVVSVGSMFATTNSTRANEISHIFLNSVKHKDLKDIRKEMNGHNNKVNEYLGITKIA